MSDNNFNENEKMEDFEAPDIIIEPSNPIIEDTETVTEQSGDTQPELELDPLVTETVFDENVDNADNYKENNPLFDEQPLPIMPKVEINEYKPWKKEKGSKGVKIFALILSFLIVASAFMTAGYFLGNKSQNDPKAPNVNLASKPLKDGELSVSQVFEIANKSVVGIYVYNTEGVLSTASGVIYSKDGYVVTNDHIYSGAANPKFKVYTSDGKMYSANFVAGDTRSDLAVLKINEPQNLTPAVFGDSDELIVGETVVAVGRPNGATEDSIATEGVVADKSRRVAITTSYTGNYIQTNTAINPGSSGGALYNAYGQVVGITSAKLVGDVYEGIGFAIPTTVVKKNVELLIEHKYIKGRAKLGISYTELDALSAEMSKLPAGLKIATIDSSSPLANKNVEVGDIITKVGALDITSSSVILDIIDSKSAGETLELTIYSTKKKKTLEISIILLEDKGGSSYNKATTSQNSNSSSDDSDNYNTDIFPFPNGD